MAIQFYQTDDGRVPNTEYLPCGAIIPKVGMALKMEDGNLTAAARADKPLYLSLTERVTVCQEGAMIPVARLGEDIILEASTPEGFTAKAGDMVQLAADGMGLSAVAGGAAEIVYSDADITRFRIVQPSGAQPAMLSEESGGDNENGSGN